MTCPDLPALAPVPDALAVADARLIADQALWLLPRGRAWQSDEYAPAPDAETGPARTVLRQFWRAVATPIAEFYPRLWDLVLSATVSTAPVECLPDWERDYGLPDACVPVGTTIEARRRAVLARMLGPAGARVEDIACWLERHGITAIVTEPVGFECGYSGCGGSDEMAAPDHLLRVAVEPTRTEYFEVGAGECGLTPLGAVIGLEAALCSLDRVVAAHINLDILTLPRVRADETGWRADSLMITADAA